MFTLWISSHVTCLCCEWCMACESFFYFILWTSYINPNLCQKGLHLSPRCISDHISAPSIPNKLVVVSSNNTQQFCELFTWVGLVTTLWSSQNSWNFASAKIAFAKIVSVNQGIMPLHKISDLLLLHRRRGGSYPLKVVILPVFLLLTVFLCSDWSSSSSLVQAAPAPSSAWNQPALAINTINPRREKKKGSTNGSSSTSGGNGKSILTPIVNNGLNNGAGNELQKKKTYTWNTIIHYGLSGGSDHNIRHKSKKLRDHSKLPCPFDQIRSWWDGKCRPAPRFSLYRVG